MSESLFADEWIYSTLAADTTLNGLVGTRLYPDVAPQQAVFPLVVWTLQESFDVVGQGTFRIMNRCVYSVRTIGKTRSYWQLKPIYEAIDGLLHGKGADTANAHIFSSMRTEEFRLAEFTDNVDYRTLGGLYQILVQKV